MWGVSWANVEMMLADAQRTDYDSKHDGKDNINDSNVIDLSNIADVEKLRRMAQ